MVRPTVFEKKELEVEALLFDVDHERDRREADRDQRHEA
jgi:hypothetical protein